MSPSRSLDVDLGPVLGAWLADEAGAGTVTYLGDVLERTRRTPQRAAWLFPGRWLPVTTPRGPMVVPRRAWQLLVVGLLVAALVAAVAIVGSRRLPAPFGLARPGLIAFDTGRDIALMNDDGSARRLLTSGPDADTSPTWSPDGTLVAFWRADGTGTWTIIVMDADGRVAASVDVQATTPLPYPSDDPRWSMLGFALGAPSVLAWSPDSRRLAFAQAANGEFGIWVVEADGSGLRRLGDPTVPARDPAWSPDGSQIAFDDASRAGGAATGVWVMRADGTGARRLSTVEGNGESFRYPQWQPGGELIAFTANPTGRQEVFVIRADAAGELDLSASRPDTTTNDWLPTWSPDGSRIAWLAFPPDSAIGELVISDPDGRNLTIPPGQPGRSLGLPTWSPDGRAMTVFAGDPATSVATELLVFDLAGTLPPRVIPLADNAGGSSWQRLAP